MRCQPLRALFTLGFETINQKSLFQHTIQNRLTKIYFLRILRIVSKITSVIRANKRSPSILLCQDYYPCVNVNFWTT